MYKVQQNGKLINDLSNAGEKGESESLISNETCNTQTTTSCKRTNCLTQKAHTVPKTSTPVKSQIVIMSSVGMPISLDESSTIDITSVFCRQL